MSGFEEQASNFYDELFKYLASKIQGKQFLNAEW